MEQGRTAGSTHHSSNTPPLDSDLMPPQEGIMKVNLPVSRRGGGIAFLKAPWRQCYQFRALRTWEQLEEVPLDEKGCRTSTRSARVQPTP